MYVNDNGVKEVFDVFTLCGGQPKHLLDFQSRNWCTGISEDGRIFQCASGGAACQIYYAYTISPGGETLNYEAVHKCGDEYTYFSAQDCAPENIHHENNGQTISFEDGEELINRLTDDDYSDDDAPFAEFVPMF